MNPTCELCGEPSSTCDKGGAWLCVGCHADKTKRREAADGGDTCEYCGAMVGILNRCACPCEACGVNQHEHTIEQQIACQRSTVPAVRRIRAQTR